MNYLPAQTFYFFIGTYTTKGSKGIYVYKFNTNTGKADFVSSTDSIPNPSYLAIAKNNRFVYAVSEVSKNNLGSVSAFDFDSTNGQLTFINSQTTGAPGPCYVTVDNENTHLFAANYNGGCLTSFPINVDGSIAPYSQLIQHQGSSVNAQRQEKPHVHSTVLSPDEKFLYVADLGTDKLNIYQFNPAERLSLYPFNPAYKVTPPGSGPRHFTFHPNNKFAYLIEEMGGTVEAFKYNEGNLVPIQRIATHPADYKGAIGSADIHVSPDGKFLYASNRGDENNIAIFSVNVKTGKLTAKGYQSTMGIKPRNFAIDPTGQYLLVANQDSDNIVIFKRDMKTGILTDTGEQLKVSMPVCIKFMQ